MLGILSEKSKVMLGIDISSAAVKVLELSRIDERYRVESYTVAPLPSGAISDKTIKDSEAVSNVVGAAYERAKSSLKNAAIAVPDSAVITKIVQMDGGFDDDEVESQIIFEADKHIPYPLEEVSLDFNIVGPNATNTSLNDVLIVASRTENVQNRSKAVEAAGLTVKLVDVESYAVERACGLIASSLPNEGTDQTIAVVDIGATTTNLTVLYNNSTIFTREELFGGQRLTEDIQRHYGLSYEEAGLAKKKGDLPDDYQTEVLGPFKEAAVLQVRRALQFFFSTSQHSKVNHILLAGGTAVIPGLAELIQNQIGITTTIANPFADMTIAKQVDVTALIKDGPAMMVSVGLAMRSFK